MRCQAAQIAALLPSSHSTILTVRAAALVVLVVLAGLVLITPAANAADLPVREVTVFKDGHAFVVREGRAPTDKAGDVLLDHVPAPVIGTFWAYTVASGPGLAGISAGYRQVAEPQTALTQAELLEANPGARVRIQENDDTLYEATVLGIPSREVERDPTTLPLEGAPVEVERSNLVLLEVNGATRVVPVSRIEHLSFPEPPRTEVERLTTRARLHYHLDWGSDRPAGDAGIGMVTLENGLRWIPSYRVELDGAEHARIRLQGTLVDNLVDLDGATVNLVVGVPRFAFSDTVDPISLQQDLAEVAGAARSDTRIASSFSNAIMTQAMQPVMTSASTARSGSAEVIGLDGARSEDLYVFTINDVHLARGERLVLPIAEVRLPVRHVFTLNLPFGPPAEARGHMSSDQQRELARLLGAPSVDHCLRLVNTGTAPLTTAPALILDHGRVLAQSMMTYAAPGSTVDLEVTAAVDIPVRLRDVEAGRTPDAERWSSSMYDRIDLEGTITLTSHRDTPATLEVERFVMGHLDSAEPEAVIEHRGWNDAAGAFSNTGPTWWSWSGWPGWWFQVNPIGSARWDLALDPGESTELVYRWHYLWD